MRRSGIANYRFFEIRKAPQTIKPMTAAAKIPNAGRPEPDSDDFWAPVMSVTAATNQNAHPKLNWNRRDMQNAR